MTCAILYKNLVRSIFHKYNLNNNLSPSLRPIAHFTLEIECPHAASIKLLPKDVAMYVSSLKG